VLRGQFVLQQLLCRAPPPPPAAVPPEPPARAGLSRKERLAQHRQAACASCHVLMDPIGLAFESYDAAGAYRTSDGGVAIDASGELWDGRRFDGPRALAGLLAADEGYAQCFARQLLAYALGRSYAPDSADDAVLGDAVASFRAGSRGFGALVDRVVTSRSFRFRRPDVGRAKEGGS
jgi:hypothetical protein